LQVAFVIGQSFLTVLCMKNTPLPLVEQKYFFFKKSFCLHYKQKKNKNVFTSDFGCDYCFDYLAKNQQPSSQSGVCHHCLVDASVHCHLYDSHVITSTRLGG
jgi:hypothetical protein